MTEVLSDVQGRTSFARNSSRHRPLRSVSVNDKLILNSQFSILSHYPLTEAIPSARAAANASISASVVSAVMLIRSAESARLPVMPN